MAQSAQFVGIDCGKASLDVAVFPTGERTRVANDAAGHVCLIGWLFAQAKGQRAKTDVIDAGLIADFTAHFQPAATPADPHREGRSRRWKAKSCNRLRPMRR